MSPVHVSERRSKRASSFDVSSEDSADFSEISKRKRRATATRVVNEDTEADDARSDSEVPAGDDNDDEDKEEEAEGEEEDMASGDEGESDGEEFYEDEPPLPAEDDPEGLSALPATVLEEDNVTIERASSLLPVAKFKLIDDESDTPYVTHTDLARLVGLRGRQLFSDFPTVRLKRVTMRQARDLVDRHILNHLMLRGHRVVVVPLANAYRLLQVHRTRLLQERPTRASIDAAALYTRMRQRSDVDPPQAATAFNSRLLEARRRQQTFADFHTNIVHVPLGSLPYLKDHIPGKYPVAVVPGQYQEAFPVVSYTDLKVLDELIATRKATAAATAAAATAAAATPAPPSSSLNTNIYAALAQELLAQQRAALSSPGGPILCSHMISNTQQCQALVSQVGEFCRTHRTLPRPITTAPCAVRTNAGVCGRPSGRFASGRCDVHFNGTSFLCGEQINDATPPCPMRVPGVSERCAVHRPRAVRCFRCQGDLPAGEAITCARCGRSGDLACWELKDALLAKVRRYAWECYDCKRCIGCNKAEDEAHLLICDTCDRGFHTYCHNPRLTRAPSGSWSCQHCTSAPATPKHTR